MNINLTVKKFVSEKKASVGVGSILSDKPISKRAKYTDYDLTSKLKFSQLEHSIFLHNELHQSKHNTASGSSSDAHRNSGSSSSDARRNSGSSSSSDANRNSGSSSSDQTGAISDGSDKQSMPLTESNLAMNDPMSYCAKQRRR
jgi:hypothetical protein